MSEEQAEQAAKKSAKKSTGKAAKKSSSGVRPPRTGVGEYIRAQLKLKNPRSNAEIAEAARKKFPGAKTSPGSVAWYRNRSD